MTDPLDPTNYLKITSFTPVPDFNPAKPAFVVSFTSFPGLSYSLQSDANLEFSGPQARIHPIGSVNDFTVSAEVKLLPGRDFVRVRRDP